MKRNIRKICLETLKENPQVISVSCVNILTLASYFQYRARTNNASYSAGDESLTAACFFINFQSPGAHTHFINMYIDAFGSKLESTHECEQIVLKSHMCPGHYKYYTFVPDKNESKKYLREQYLAQELHKSGVPCGAEGSFLYEICLPNGYKIGEFWDDSFIFTSYLKKDFSRPSIFDSPENNLNLVNYPSQDLCNDFWNVFKYTFYNLNEYYEYLSLQVGKPVDGKFQYINGVKQKIKKKKMLYDSSIMILFENTLIRDFYHPNVITKFNKWIKRDD